MQRSLWILAAAGLMSACPASAQDLGLLYGRGVHAYFNGQSREAYSLLNSAINGGSQDPRAYYFRGLAYQRLGRPTEADADFLMGAQLEHQDVGGVYGVDRALERVQGPARLAIERHRAAARVEAAQEVVLERNRRTLTARAATPDVSAPGDQILAEPPSDFNRLPAAGAPPVKGEVDKPFVDPAADPNAPPPATPARPKPAQPNPLTEPPNGAAPPAKPAAPAANANPPPAGEEPAGSGRALGNAIKRALGGFVPSLPELPAGLPIGGQGEAQPAQPPAQAPPAAKPAPAKNDNPFGNP